MKRPEHCERSTGPSGQGEEPEAGRLATTATRVLFALAIAGPPLALGGVHPQVVVGFLVVVLLAWLLVCRPARGRLVVPAFVGLGLAASAVTLLQWLPWPWLRAALAPRMDELVVAAMHGLSVEARPGLTTTPGDTGLEVARLFGLSILFVVAAQLRWRVAAAVVVATGTAVALVGFAHEALAVDRIYGLYAAHDVDLATAAALRGPFVNANHQSGLLLLGIFASAALAVDQTRRGTGLADPRQVDRFAACIAALLIQVPALVLSLSRGALLVFIVLAPVAAVLAWTRPHPPGEARPRLPRIGAELAIVACVIALFGGLAGQGAWGELSTLASIDAGELTRKLAGVRDALALIQLSPLLGIGRGAFVELYPGAQSLPSHRLTTHLECAPAAMIVEWGPVVGVLLAGGIVAFFWRAWTRGDEEDRTARRIALLGLLALGLQGLADFSLEFLGVAAPAVALAGGLAAGPSWSWPRRTIGGTVAAGLLAVLALAIASAPHTRLGRVRTDDPAALEEALAMRPLDGQLHGLLARRSAEAGDWSVAAHRAEIATRLRPGNIDAWLLRAAAAQHEGDAAGADLATARALALVHELPSPELVQWLVERYPQPGELALLGPDDRVPWRLVVDALAETSPVHADAFAAARGAGRPRDAEPLRVRHAMALRQHNPALALHHARLLRQLAPAEGASHVAVAQALRSFDPPRLGEAQLALERALDDEGAMDGLARAAVEQELVLVLLELGDPHALVRARVVVGELLTRPASRSERAFRERLAAQVRAADGGRW